MMRLTVAALVAAAALVIAWRATRPEPPRDAAAALEQATRALQRAPGDAQATWDRASALGDLGLWRASAVAFEAIASRGEKRGDEAKSRAVALRAEIARQDARAPAAASDAVKELMQKSAAARAQGRAALADAYVDEARLVMR